MTLAAMVYGLTAFITVSLSLGVLFSRRPLLSGYYLTGTMIGVGALFWELASPTLGAIQILVYGGGVLVMVLFVMMMTPSGVSLPPLTPGWRILWILPPMAGILAATHAPDPLRRITGTDLGTWLLLHQGFSLEALAILLMGALVAAVAIAADTVEQKEDRG